jgi:hypothetical protein
MRRQGRHVPALRGKLLADLGLADYINQKRFQLLAMSLRHRRGHGHSHPDIDIEILDTEFGERGHIRRQGAAVACRDGQRHNLAGAHLLHG